MFPLSFLLTISLLLPQVEGARRTNWCLRSRLVTTARCTARSNPRVSSSVRKSARPRAPPAAFSISCSTIWQRQWGRKRSRAGFRCRWYKELQEPLLCLGLKKRSMIVLSLPIYIDYSQGNCHENTNLYCVGAGNICFPWKCNS